MHKRLLVALISVCAFAAVAAIPATASKKVTLKYFSKVESATVTDANGAPLTGEPTVGSHLEVTDRNYLGNHKKHERKYSSTDHLVCTFTGPNTALCDGQFAIGGSMLLVQHQNITFKDAGLTVAITGGTGKFKGMKGTVVSTNIGDNSDDVITLH